MLNPCNVITLPYKFIVIGSIILSLTIGWIYDDVSPMILLFFFSKALFDFGNKLRNYARGRNRRGKVANRALLLLICLIVLCLESGLGDSLRKKIVFGETSLE